MAHDRLPLSVDERPVLVPIASLSLAGSPRSRAEDAEHLRALTATTAKLPPIIVHRPTMRVIDGRHRVLAARRRGEEHIEARFFHGDDDHAFVLAVSANLVHGLPLSFAERRAAAARILGTHPRWSDRVIASLTGISARTVADVRGGLGASGAGRARVGSDGRSRPVDGAEGRRAAAEIMEREPGLSLRQVARRAGISHETARDVRKRMLRRESPVPERLPGDPVAAVTRPALRRLRSAPALQESEDGRALLRLLLAHTGDAGQWHRLTGGVPPHRGGTVAELALECARLWAEFADRVERADED
ncbi:streptomycin biosynthesis protein [Actinomadura soli]|uniref:Streptomycin biosynthesis protein n=1 Tax=Actinomadura soli TaxID=2508997 RepID=A0A5C4JM86_9ACTN|nr:ParB/RepB/Spo0J family partition protein [Actinomadura soli]TMR07239.1 streptomycin biosynthesis protein [Actinomadura soli]